MYYTTLKYYQTLFQTTEREYAFHAQTKDEYWQWKDALRKRLAEISGYGRTGSADRTATFFRGERSGGSVGGKPWDRERHGAIGRDKAGLSVVWRTREGMSFRS